MTVTVEPAELGEPSYINITFATGTDIDLIVEYGTEYMDISFLSSPSEVHDYTHIFSAAGSHLINVTASNTRGTVSSLIYAEVDVPIKNSTIDVAHSEIGSPVQLTIESLAGTRVTGFLLYGDEYGELRYLGDYTAYPVIEYTFEELGIYSAVVRLGNTVSYEDVEIKIAVNTPIAGLTLDSNLDLVNVTTEVEFVRTISAGDFMTCATDYGDGWIRIVSNDSVVLEDIYYHIFSDSGVYHPAVTCSNWLGSSTYTMPVAIVSQEPMNFTLTPTETIIFAFGNDLVIGWNHTVGTNITFVSKFDGVTTGTVDYNFGDVTGKTTFTNTQYKVGHFNILVQGSNRINDVEDSIDVIIDKIIAGLSVAVADTYVNPSETFDLHVECMEGSNIIFDITDDVNPTEEEIRTYSLGGLFSEYFLQSYSTPGYYNINVTAFNNVSTQNSAVFVGIEDDIPAETTLAIRNTTNLVDEAVFTLSQPDAPPPTSAIITWNYGDNSQVVEEVFDISYGNDFVHTHVFPDYGFFDIYASANNNLSSNSWNGTVQVGVFIEGTTLTLDTDPVVVGEPAYFTAHVEQGSDLLHTLDVGDGTTALEMPRTDLTDWTAADDVVFEVTYTQSGPMRVLLTTSNVFNQELGTVDLKVYIPVAGHSLTVAAYAKTNTELDVTSTLTTGFDVTTTIDYGDGSGIVSTPYPRVDASEFPAEVIHTYTSPGNYTIVCESSNEVNTVTTTGPTVVVQNALTDITLSVDANPNFPLPIPTAEVIFVVTLDSSTNPPTDPFCLFTFPDGSVEDVYSPQLMTGNPVIYSHVFPEHMVGTHSTYVNCSNLVSGTSSTTHFTLQRTIEQPTVTVLKSKLRVNDFVNVTAQCTAASHMSIIANFGDGTSVTIPHENQLNSTQPMHISHQYTTSGNFSLWIIFQNDLDVDPINVYPEEVVVVQQPIEGLLVEKSVDYNIAYPPGEFSLDISTPENVNPPTNVFLEISFDTDSAPVLIYAPQMSATTKVTVPHTYQSAIGNTSISVNASNLVSSSFYTSYVSIDRAVSGVTLSSSSSSYVTGNTSSFLVTCEFGTDVTINLDYGDGIFDSVQIPGPCGDADRLFTHVYTDPGTFTVVVAIHNFVTPEPVTAQVEIVTQNAIIVDDISVELESEVISSEEALEFALHIINGKPVPTDVTIEVKFDVDDVGETLSGITFPLPLTHTYAEDDVGDKEVTLHLSNLISSDMIQIPIQIQQIIEAGGASFPRTVMTGENFTSTIHIIKGSHVRVTVDTGDGMPPQSAYSVPVKNVFTFSHIYNHDGTYEVTYSSSNHFGSTTLAAHIIEVQNPTGDFIATTTSPIGSTTSVSVISVQRVDESLPPPSNVKIQFNCLASNTEVAYPVESFDTTIQLDACALVLGTNIIEVNVSNLVSFTVEHVEVIMLEVIEEPFFTIKTALQANEPTVLAFNMGESLELRPGVSYGSNVSFIWLIGDEEILNDGADTLVLPFNNPGENVITLTASNPVSSVSTEKTVQIISSLLKSVTYNRSIITEDTWTIDIALKEVPQAGSAVCYSIKLVQNTTLETITHLAGTSSDSCGGELTEAIELSTSYTLAFTLQTIGGWKLTVDIVVGPMKREISDLVQVDKMPCFPVTISAKEGLGSEPASPISFKRADRISMGAEKFDITTNCRATNVVEKNWKVTAVSTEIVLLPNALYSGVSEFVEFAEKYFEPDLYTFELSIRMENLEETRDSAILYVKVERSPLYVEIMGADRNKIGFGNNITVNGITNSHDPDTSIDDKSDMVTTWYCMKESEAAEFWAGFTTKEAVPLIPFPKMGDPGD